MPASVIYLKSVKRLFSGTFPLETIGITENLPIGERTVLGKLGFSIRLGNVNQNVQDSIGDKVLLLKYPNVAIRLPDVKHSSQVAHPHDTFFFHYDSNLLEPMRKAGFMTASDAWSFTMKPSISNKLKDIKELMPQARKPGIADQLDLLAIQLLELLQLDRALQPETHEGMEARLRKIAAWLRLNVNQPVNILQLAAKNGFSPRNFFRCWKEYFPVSPARYVKELKMQEAVRLLQETNMTVDAIAKELGYQTTGYFCQQFNAKMHQTPLKYRHSHQSSNPVRNYWQENSSPDGIPSDLIEQDGDTSQSTDFR